MATEACTAVLRHDHGVMKCWNDAGHDDRHHGLCDLCDEETWLYWTEMCGDWTRPATTTGDSDGD